MSQVVCSYIMELTLNLLASGEQKEEEEEEGKKRMSRLVVPFIPQLLDYLNSVIRGEGGRGTGEERSFQLEFSVLSK